MGSTVASVTKPLPIITPDSAPFWQSCCNGQLRLQRCVHCTAWRYPPAPVCRRCGATEAEWLPTSQHGRIHSFVIYHRPFHPAYTTEVPYAVALVDLDEGIRMLLRVVDSPLASLAIGVPGDIRYEQVTSEIALPVFTPRGAQ